MKSGRSLGFCHFFVAGGDGGRETRPLLFVGEKEEDSQAQHEGVHVVELCLQVEVGYGFGGVGFFIVDGDGLSFADAEGAGGEGGGIVHAVYLVGYGEEMVCGDGFDPGGMAGVPGAGVYVLDVAGGFFGARHEEQGLGLSAEVEKAERSAPEDQEDADDEVLFVHGWLL